MRVLVLGCGRVGAQIAVEAASAGYSVAVVDRDRSSFRRLPESFPGKTWLGDGIDRPVLEAAGIVACDALAAVMYGDNSNIVAARIAKETYAIASVVARIKDPRRAEVYQRLGIPTVAPVTWAADQVLRRLFPENSATDWTHPSGDMRLVERELPPTWAGRLLDRLVISAERYRLVTVTRGGQPKFAAPGLCGQQGDILHVVATPDGENAFDAALRGGPAS